MVLASWFVSSRRSRKRARGRACSKAPIESKPLSGPRERRRPVQQRRFVAQALPGLHGLPRAQPGEGRGHLGIPPRLRVEVLEAVVGGPAASLVEGGVPRLERLEEGGPARYLPARGPLELHDPRIER